jgi:hypothetical protein
MLSALGIAIEDLLLSPANVDDSGQFDQVPIVSPDMANLPEVIPHPSRESLRMRRSLLEDIRPKTAGARSDWRRFVALHADAATIKGMHFRIRERAVLLVDRHYNSLKPYRPEELNIYAVITLNGLLIRHVEVVHGTMILRPDASDVPLVTIPLSRKTKPNNLIIGRICYVGGQL